MEIIPGVGVDVVRIGDRREAVEARLGPSAHPGRGLRAVYPSDRMLVVTYDRDDVVELVEAAYSGHDGGDEVFFDGVQLTYRLMDDVVADLAAKGHVGTPFDIGFVYEPGFCVFSMASRSARDLDPDALEDDERLVVEGVGIVPRGYFDYGPLADATPDELRAWLRDQGVLPPSAD